MNQSIHGASGRFSCGVALAAVLSAALPAAADLPLYRLKSNENNVSGASGFTNALNWCLASDGSQIATEAPNPANNYVVRNDYTLRTPEPKESGMTYAFNGNVLHLGEIGGNPGAVLIRNLSYPVDITFANEGVCFHRGWCGSWNARNVNIRGKITVDAKANDPFELFVSGGNGGTMNIYAPIHGTGHLWVHTRLVSGSQASTDMRCTFRKDSLKDFHGTLSTYWCQYSKRGGGKSADGYTQTFLAEDGEFPGHLHLWPGSAYEGLTPSNVFTVADLTLGDEAVMRVAVDDSFTTASILRVTGSLAAPGRLHLKQLNAPTRSQIITATASGTYTFALTKLPFMHVEGDASTLAAAFNHDRAVADFPNYRATAEPDGTLFIEPEFSKVVRMTGSNDSWKMNSFTGTGKDSPSSWSDGKAPTDPDCAYIVSDRDMRSEYLKGAISSFLGGTLVFMNSVLLENFSGCLHFPDLRVISANAQIANLGDYGYSDRFADFPSFVTKKPFKYTGRIRMNTGYSSSSRLAFNCYSAKAMDVAAEISGVGRLQIQGLPQNAGRDDSFVGLFGLNTNFIGQVYLTSYNNNVNANRLHFYLRDARSLGGPRPVWRYDALKVDRETTIHPLEDMTLDTPNLGIHFASSPKSNFNTFDITNDVTFACKCRFTRGSIVRKIGKGTFALGGPHPYFGEDGNTVPAATSNRFEICEGALKPLSSEAFQGLELVMSNGTEIVYDVPASTTDGDVGQYGIRNTEWSTPFVLPENGVTVRFEDAAGHAAAGNGRIHEVALATVSDDATADAVGGRLNLRGFTTAEGRVLAAVLQKRTNGDGSVTLYAKLRAGLVFSVR